MKEEKDEKNSDPFSWFGSSGVNKKNYWIIITILAAVEIVLGVSVFFR